MNKDEVFLELFDGHYERIFLRFRRKGFEAEVARDLAQDTFARVYKALGEYRREGHSSYLDTVADNVWKNHLRYWAAEARDAPEVAVEDTALSVPDPASTVDHLVDAERQRLLEQAIEELPDRMRRCLRLRLDEVKYREIAAIMNVSLDTVKSLIYQAKQRLRERLGEHGDADG